MSAAPAPTSGGMSLTGRIIWFWAGLILFALIGVVGYMLSAGMATNVLWVPALLMILATGLPALWMLRRGQIAAGSGLLAGYALATVASFGQCTFLAPTLDYGFLNGFFVYLIAIAGVLVLAVIVWLVELIQARRRQ